MIGKLVFTYFVNENAVYTTIFQLDISLSSNIGTVRMHGNGAFQYYQY